MREINIDINKAMSNLTVWFDKIIKQSKDKARTAAKGLAKAYLSSKGIDDTVGNYGILLDEETCRIYEMLSGEKQYKLI